LHPAKSERSAKKKADQNCLGQQFDHLAENRLVCTILLFIAIVVTKDLIVAKGYSYGRSEQILVGIGSGAEPVKYTVDEKDLESEPQKKNSNS